MLGNFPAVNPYKVSAEYFDAFPFRMLNLVADQELKPALGQQSMPYNVPANYFEGLAEAILKKALSSSAEHQPETREAELSSLSPLLSGLSKKVPYTVPENYFNGLAGDVVSKTIVADDLASETLVPESPVEGYISEHHEHEEESEVLSPLLEGLRTQPVYTIPEGYFEMLPAALLNKVSKAAPARVVKMSFTRKVASYAAAAVVAGILITTGFFALNKQSTDNQVASATSLQEKAAQTSDEEIYSYLENLPLPIVDSSMINIKPEIGNDAILDMLADVSDEELQQYLQLQSDTKLLIN